MPSNKPRVQALVEPEIFEKFKVLCAKEKRSESNLGGYIITLYIEAYEKEHGEIQLQ